MKTNIKIVLLVLACMISSRIMSSCDDTWRKWSTAFTAGYVFKNDCRFKQVYGRGIPNMITGDLCYYLWKHGGLGAKLSYWRAKGKTDFLQQRTILQEVPFTVYVRGIYEVCSRLQIYGSLGAGFVWMKEKSYLGNVHAFKGIGELEIGLNVPICRAFYLTGAFRYLFPPQCENGDKVDVGGCDLRAGFGFSF